MGQELAAPSLTQDRSRPRRSGFRREGKGGGAFSISANPLPRLLSRWGRGRGWLGKAFMKKNKGGKDMEVIVNYDGRLKKFNLEVKDPYQIIKYAKMSASNDYSLKLIRFIGITEYKMALRALEILSESLSSGKEAVMEEIKQALKKSLY